MRCAQFDVKHHWLSSVSLLTSSLEWLILIAAYSISESNMNLKQLWTENDIIFIFGRASALPQQVSDSYINSLKVSGKKHLAAASFCVPRSCSWSAVNCGSITVALFIWWFSLSAVNTSHTADRVFGTALAQEHQPWCQNDVLSEQLRFSLRWSRMCVYVCVCVCVVKVVPQLNNHMAPESVSQSNSSEMINMGQFQALAGSSSYLCLCVCVCVCVRLRVCPFFHSILFRLHTECSRHCISSAMNLKSYFTSKSKEIYRNIKALFKMFELWQYFH